MAEIHTETDYAETQEDYTVKQQSTLKWILKTTRTAKFGVILLTVFQSAHSVSAIAFALLLRNVIDAAVRGSRAAFVSQIAELAGVVLLQILLRAGIRGWEEKVKSASENAMMLWSYQTIITRSYEAVEAYHSGELQNRLTGDTVVIADSLSSIFPNTVAMGIKLLGACTVLLCLDSRFGFVFLAGGGFLLGTSWLFRKVLKSMHKEVQEADDSVRSYLQESVSNLLILRCFGVESKALGEMEQRTDFRRKKRLRKNLFSNLCNIGFGTAMNGGYLFGLLWCGFCILDGKISFGTLTAVLQLVNQIQSPFANLTGYLPKYYAMLASAERLMELETLPEDAALERLTEPEVKSVYHNLRKVHGADVTFSYDGSIDILEHASFSIPKGSFTAIIGHSGIGKSTLLKLLLSVYRPASGQIILCDDTVETTLSAQHRPLFAYVPQGSFLMSGSIAEAVSFLSHQRGDEEKLNNALKIACADFVFDLPNGTNTRLGENGTGLSEGQIQRLAIARAIYCDAPILLLDESTSALDEETELRLLRNIQKLTDKTVIIVTHRKAALEICTQILKLDNKRFKEVL